MKVRTKTVHYTRPTNRDTPLILLSFRNKRGIRNFYPEMQEKLIIPDDDFDVPSAKVVTT
ncbi:MAG: hypothetical protein ABSD81_00590 [Methanomicrobiales archaeon]|jgi:hypothetical protein